MSDLVQLTSDKGIAIITINNPPVNALSPGVPEGIAEAIGSRLDLPAVSIPADELMVPGYFGFLANIVTQSYPASSLITRRTLGWEPAQPGLCLLYTSPSPRDTR